MIDTKTKIGKDVIESLTMGMYEDARFIYREYIQNSADQIDIAVEQGILKSRDEGYIDIEIKETERIISISDNATGIEKDKVEPILKNVAQSTKDRTKNKGFRGIGRLGGIGYCDKLIFETTFKGENVKSILTWNAKLLKEIINDRNKHEEATHVIDSVTEVRYDTAKSEEHSFKVILIGVKNNLLLVKNEIIDYLSMVAPVPFNKGFIFSSHIKNQLSLIGKEIDEYAISVNSDKVFKEYTTSIYEGEKHQRKRIDEITELQYFTINNDLDNSDIIAWGWYGISNFTKQIPANANLARGIRLRKGNIQIGSESCLVKLFKEARGNFYFFGEVHAFDKNLIPNARRDYFVENETLKYFETQLIRLFHNELHQLYFFASKVRNTKKHIDELKKFTEEFSEKTKKGFTDKTEAEKYENLFEKKKERAKDAEEELTKIKERLDDSTPKNKIFNHITDNFIEKVDDININHDSSVNKTKFLTDDLSRLNNKERKLVSRIFSVIDNVLPKELSENLKEKIREEFR